MKDIDKSIRAALAAEDRELFEEFGGEQSLFEMIAESFRGRQRWLMIGMHCNMFVLVALAVVSAIEFFRVESTRAMIAWATGFIVGCLGTWTIKLWWWTRTDRNALTREIKRVELQIARLAARLRPADDAAESS
ncbi:MAG: hypothetical protein JSV91_15505 [Phycisphaerales bacterium]|nr:MAG: hypothetical protein JSV91_15505 [Phycisphaerales bacterium]